MTDSTPEAWDARYAGDDYRFGEAPNAFLVRQAGLLAVGQQCLAVADGEGRNGVWLAERGLDVVSMDASAVAQAKARRLAAARGVKLVVEEVDLHAWTWPVAAFDVVVAIFIQFAEPPLRDLIFDGMRLTLRPGGLLIMEGYRPEQLAYGTGGPKAVENFYTEALLRERFGDFEILELSAYDAVIDEGPAHSGPSALIDLVARKPAG